MLVLKIRGAIREDETGVGLPGFLVQIRDREGLFARLFDSTYTDGSGSFEIVVESEDVGRLLDVRPDLFPRVLAPDGETVLYEPDTPARWVGWHLEDFELHVPRSHLGDLAPGRGVWLLADDDSSRDTFDVGEPLRARISGLRRVTPYDVVLLQEDASELFTVRLLSDAGGQIEPTTIWPQSGLDDPHFPEPMSLAEAQDLWRGRSLRVEVRHGQQLVLETAVRFADEFIRPLILVTDPEGRIVNGFDADTHDVVVEGYNLPNPGRLRIHMVNRQWSWRPGDVVDPVPLASGRPAFADVDVEEGQRVFQLLLAEAGEVRDGAYDFIARHLRYGYEDDEDHRLRLTDFVAYRSITGLVVRQDFMKSKAVLGGCVNALPISGRLIGGAPYFQYADTFQVGENIYGALDPGALVPAQTGKMVALYVIDHPKPMTVQGSGGIPLTLPWDRKLNHLPTLGGNPAVQKLKTQTGCINFNTRLIWPNATLEGDFDVVADLGNNATDATTFTSDAKFDPPLDIIDGYFLAGFRIVPDPAAHKEFSHAGVSAYGIVSYNTYTDVELTWMNGQWQQVPVNFLVPIQGKVFFPADAPGTTTPAQISVRQPAYPLVVIVHGQGHSYQNYDVLLEHLARNGFIAAAIHCESGMHGMSRARLMFDHLPVLKAMFGTKILPVMGLMGHSRGGEAVVMAARLNHEESRGYSFGAILSLAPTSQYAYKTSATGPHAPSLEGLWATPYLVLYGAMDEDVSGVSQTGFVLYDRARDARRCMVFAHGATHNGFIGAPPAFGAKLGTGSDQQQLLQPATQEMIAKAYTLAFFRQHLFGDTRWADMLRGAWMPASVRQAEGGKARIYVQYGEEADSVLPTATRLILDDFEEAHTPTSWQVSTIGGAVIDDGTLIAPPNEGPLFPNDTHSPHETSGLSLSWNNLGDRLRFMIPSSYRNLSAMTAISFRVAQKVDSSLNQVGQPQDLYVTLTDSHGRSRSIKASKFAEIPAPQLREVAIYTKSALCTIRIPLHVFNIEVVNTDRVDLSNVASLAFSFGVTSTGEIELDNVEFVRT